MKKYEKEVRLGGVRSRELVQSPVLLVPTVLGQIDLTSHSKVQCKIFLITTYSMPKKVATCLIN